MNLLLKVVNVSDISNYANNKKFDEIVIKSLYLHNFSKKTEYVQKRNLEVMKKAEGNEV